VVLGDILRPREGFSSFERCRPNSHEHR
jgi:hypothetical protein